MAHRPGHSVAWKRDHPWTRAARRSPQLRRQLDREGKITPHFAWSEMADTGGTPVPRSLRRNAIRHCWNLERLRHQLALAARHHHQRFSGVSIDGPFRTPAHNRTVGGASESRHLFADASDHFVTQVSRWQRETGLSRAEILAICDRIFKGMGNETSGTLHLDSRPGPIARFVHWVTSTGGQR